MPFAGSDASKQPADIPDCLPHETAVGWARHFMKSRPLGRQGGLDAMAARLEQLLSEAAAHINGAYDVDRLCRGAFMDRMRELKAHGGERLNH